MRERHAQLQREQAFHDRWAAEDPARWCADDASFRAVTAPENRFILRRLGELRGRRILDLGCGHGESSLFFARQGARVTACDLSSGMVEATCERAQAAGLRIDGVVASADAIDRPAHSFDIVYAANLLHHVPDPASTIAEAARLLTPAGHLCFWDPLRYNPLIALYRQLSRQVHSADEQPLGRPILGAVRRHFTRVDWDCFWLASLWIFCRFFLREGRDPRRERYWKTIIIEHERLGPSYRRLARLDRLGKSWPGLRWLAWNIAVVAQGPRH